MNIINSIGIECSKMRVCGLMTGTSLDAIDIAIVDFTKDIGMINMQLIDYTSVDFPDAFRSKIKNLLNTPTLSDISDLNFALSKQYSEAIIRFCTLQSIDYDSIDIISSHGQTLWHNPMIKDFAGVDINSTLQLGNGSALAKFSRKPVISDFRSGDIALNGQGAPLVPRFDYDFLSQKDKNVISLNIGGISNITYLKAGTSELDVIAFDTGCGNVLLDMTVKKYFNKDYDNNGEIAKSGKLNPQLLSRLFNCEYFELFPPKSTGRELFNSHYLDMRLRGINILPEDIIHTLSVFTADSIYRQTIKFACSPDILIIAGGGAYNSFIVDYLRSKFKSTEIKTSDDYNIPVSAKEAICFAYLGYRTLLGLPSNMPSVTGASRESILGSISLP